MVARVNGEDRGLALHVRVSRTYLRFDVTTRQNNFFHHDSFFTLHFLSSSFCYSPTASSPLHANPIPLRCY